MGKINSVLLDMDGCLSNFFSSALVKLNKATGQSISESEYIKHQSFDMEKVWGLSMDKFWAIIEDTDDYWYNLAPYPWFKDIYSYLSGIGEVTIATSPSPHGASCPTQKLKWLKKYLNIDAHSVMIGSRKYLMANPNTVLVDDYHKNIDKFIAAGGQGCLLRSNWNTPNHSWETVKQDLDKFFYGK